MPPARTQAVCHSASAKGTGEVSTSNYEARAFGVRSGMLIRCGGGCTSRKGVGEWGLLGLARTPTRQGRGCADRPFPRQPACHTMPARSRAKELCPHLIVVPYMFEQYETVSEKVRRRHMRCQLHLGSVGNQGSAGAVQRTQSAGSPAPCRSIASC